MMAYEDGLRLLASLETPRSPDMDAEDYRGWVDDLIASKYTYIVASQVRRALELSSRFEISNGFEETMDWVDSGRKSNCTSRGARPGVMHWMTHGDK